MMGRSQWVRRPERLPVLRTASLILTFLVLMPAAGCSRPSEFSSDVGGNQADQGKLPFRDNGAKGSGSSPGAPNSGEASAQQAPKSDPREASGAPFQELSSVPELPPGTLVTVRLEKQISSDRIGDQGMFAAVVDEPVVMDGKMAVPRGATVTGRIESARASDGGGGRGYIRLTLDTITIAGKTLPLRTSSLFVRGSGGEVLSPGQNEAEQAHPTVTRLQKGRRLTFRLAATVPLERQATESSSPNHLPGTE
jgi:hypothetical protein